MRKTILIVVAVAIIAGLAFGAGVWTQGQYQLAAIGQAEKFARDLTGLDDPVPPAPPWEEWSYPQAKSLGPLGGPSVRVMGKLERPAGHYSAWTTADPLTKVARFYTEKIGFQEAEGIAASRSAVSSEGTAQGDLKVVLDDCEDASTPRKPRPVQTKVLMRRCPSYDVSLVLSRADGEGLTHIVLLYDPKTEARAAKP